MKDLKRLSLVVVGIICTVGSVPSRTQEVTAAATQVRSYATSRFALELNGGFAGFVDVAEGGNGFGEVVEAPLIESMFYRKKHLAGVGFRALTLEVGSDMSPALADWIQATAAGNFTRKDGAIVSLDAMYTERRRVEFHDAWLTEVRIPALDATSKDALKLTVVLQPEFTRQVAPQSGKYAASSCKQKTALSSNFRLSIDGVDASRTRAIDALTVKVVFTDGGERTGPQPRYVSFSDVLVQVSESGADSFDKWFQDFVIRGNANDDQEKGGTLELLGPNLSSALMTLTFNHLGILELAPANQGANDQVGVMLAKMYVESMSFSMAPACGG